MHRRTVVRNRVDQLGARYGAAGRVVRRGAGEVGERVQVGAEQLAFVLRTGVLSVPDEGENADDQELSDQKERTDDDDREQTGALAFAGPFPAVQALQLVASPGGVRIERVHDFDRLHYDQFLFGAVAERICGDRTLPPAAVRVQCFDHVIVCAHIALGRLACGEARRNQCFELEKRKWRS